MKLPYNYAIIKENFPDLERESTLIPGKWKNKKYAMIIKVVHKDGTESITYIKYRNDLQGLQNDARGFVSWFNYPLGIAKNINGNLMEI